MKKRRSGSALRKKRDFSNNIVVAVLLVLVVVSIISIGLYLHTISSVKPKFLVNEGKAAAEVTITITKAPGELTAQPTAPQGDINLNSIK